MVAAHSAVVLKAESVADKTEWLNKLRIVISSKGGQVKGESVLPIRQSLSDGSLVSNYLLISPVLQMQIFPKSALVHQIITPCITLFVIFIFVFFLFLIIVFQFACDDFLKL